MSLTVAAAPSSPELCLPSPALWYAGFGSNLNDDRFALYLSGGRRSGLNRVYRGARDTAPPQAAVTCTAAGAMRFAGQFDVWGGGGGASFFVNDPSRVVLLRAFLVRPQQLADLVVQENGMNPREHEAVADGVLEQLGSLLQAAPEGQMAGRTVTVPLEQLPPEATYDRLHLLDAHGLDGLRYRVLVLGTSRQPERNAPPEYLEALREGLVRFCGLPPQVAQQYLQTCLDNP